jgi:hypothetical protein
LAELDATNTIARTGQSGWLRQNGRLLAVSAAFFLLNQLLEFVVLTWTGHSHISLCRWDCGWYEMLVNQGYDPAPHGVGDAHPRHDAANWVFFPAFPLLAMAVRQLTGLAGSASLVLAGRLCFLLATFAFVKLASSRHPGEDRPLAPRLDPILAAAVVTLHPYAIYGNAGYTEPLFLLLTCTFFYWLRRDVLVAGLAGCLLACTRIVGVFAALSYLAAAVAPWKKDRTRRDRIVLGLLLIPAGLGAFLLYLHGLSGDALAFAHLQRAWNRIPGNPFGHIWRELFRPGHERYWAVMCALALLAPVYLALRKHYELALFALLCTLLPLSTGLEGSQRYIWWQAPILLALGAVISRRKLWVPFFAVSVPGLAYMYLLWFSGEGFVI